MRRRSETLSLETRRPALRAATVRIPISYAAVAAAYIIVSTLAFGLYFRYESQTLLIEIAKGLGFVLVTALVLYVLLRQQYGAAERHETQFYSLVENLPDAVLLLRVPERTILYANPAARAMFGYEEDELVGSSTEILHVDAVHFAEFDRMAPRDFSVGDTIFVDYELRRKNGEVFPTSHLVTLFSREDGSAYALSVIRDEAERRGYERRLRESEERLRQIADNLREVLWITDPEKTELHYVNPAYELVWGRSIEELKYNPRAFIEAVHPEDRARVEDLAARQSTGEYDIQYRIQRPDGEVRWIWDRAVPIRGEDGIVTRIVGIAEDITELRQQEAELRQAQKMEAVGQLTGGIAHDFNNLLTVILGNAESLREAVPDDDEAKEDLGAIISAGKRGASLTQRLLAFSRQQILSSDRIDLNALVEDMTSLLRRTLGEQVEIRTELAGAVEPILADRAQLETSIMNLAINARDAMPEGGTITLTTAPVSVAAGSEETRWGVEAGEYVRLSVEDTGDGMTQAVAAKVFDPFFTTKEPGKGTGLGLSTVYGFARQSGGSIRVQSAKGRGTRFDVLLPLRIDDEESDTVASSRLTALPVGDETVLVVEDDPMVRAFTTSQLRGLGYVVLDAGSGHDALELLETHDEVRLLFTDIVMPGGMSGPELAVTAQQRRPGIRVLFTSGYAEIALHDETPAASPARVLRKPYTPKQLAAAVRGAIDRPE